MTPTPDRIPWDWLRQNYPIWKKKGYWLRAALWFGKVIPVVKESAGYIFSSDRSVPSSVSLENFRAIVNLAKELGAYG